MTRYPDLGCAPLGRREISVTSVPSVVQIRQPGFFSSPPRSRRSRRLGGQAVIVRRSPVSGGDQVPSGDPHGASDDPKIRADPQIRPRAASRPLATSHTLAAPPNGCAFLPPTSAGKGLHLLGPLLDTAGLDDGLDVPAGESARELVELEVGDKAHDRLGLVLRNPDDGTP